ncbi:hypothetical protein D3C72_1307150 [compost metagenome]
MRAVLAQPVVQLVAERAEVAVAAITQREHAVLQVAQGRRRGHHPAQEGQGVVGCIAFAGGADDEQCTRAVRKQVRIHVVQTTQAHRHAGRAQGLRTALGQFAGEAGLAGPDQQHRLVAAFGRVIAWTAAPPHHGARQRIQRGGGQCDDPLPRRRRTLPPGFAQVQTQQGAADHCQQDQHHDVAKGCARETSAHAACSSSSRWKALLRVSRGPSAARSR